MADADSTVLVVDDDPGLRESVGRLLRSLGLEAQLFGTIADFLHDGRPDGPTCLVLDVRLPGRSGLDFQRELAAANIHVPIIFITGYGDIPMSVQAIKGGAIEFLTKPVRDQDLLDAIQLGLARDRAWLDNEKALATVRARFSHADTGIGKPARSPADRKRCQCQVQHRDVRPDDRWLVSARAAYCFGEEDCRG